MHPTDRESSSNSAPPASLAGDCARTDPPHPNLLSPTIQRSDGEGASAFEMKFILAEEVAQQVEAWAAEHLQRDAYADPHGVGSYQTTTLYLDTPALDVFHRTAAFRGQKFRLRRYGNGERIYLERKTRRGDRVEKKRSDVAFEDLKVFQFDGATVDWAGHWFRDRVFADALRPTCRLTYERTAFVRASPTGPLRVTLDRKIRGVHLGDADWELRPVDDPTLHGGACILPGLVICEFKFREQLPAIFKEVMSALQLQSGSMSKYGHVLTAAGLVRREPVDHA